MPIILLLTLINIVLIVHAAKTGRFSPWGYAGPRAEACEVLADVVKRIELAPRYVRKAQAEWLAMARQALKV
jgi:hypothetical protein